MSSPTRPSTLVRGRSGRLLGACGGSLRCSAPCLVVDALPAQADPAVAPRSGSFTVRGAGWGHGWGMSQYGAYGAARKGLNWKQILAFYYPGTKLKKTCPPRSMLKVWVTGDTDGRLRVLPARGLKVRDGVGGSYTVPTGSKYKSWRISRSGSGYRLSYRNADGRDVTSRTGLSNSTWTFYSPSKIVRVVMPSGSVRTVPRLGGAGQVGQQRPHRQPGAGGGLRPGRGAGGDADLLAGRGGARPGRGRPVLRGPAARLHRATRLRPLRHHGLPGLPAA